MTVQSVTVTILNMRGLHARAASKFVQAASRFDAEVTVIREGDATQNEPAIGTSVLGLMSIGAEAGAKLIISATGLQAKEALDALRELILQRFGEDS